MDGLRDIRVVDLSTGIAGGYATKLFADAGADVVKVEPPGGDPLRRFTSSGADLGGGDGALFRFLHQSKRSVVGRPGDSEVLDLMAGADLVVESFEPGVIDELDPTGRFPALVVLSISPYGRGGPWSAGRPVTEFTLQAECGSIGGRGRPGRPPVQAGGRVAEWAAGSFGAPAALAAVHHARRTGRGAHIDVSMLECMTLATNLFGDLFHSLAGRPALDTAPPRFVELPSIEPTADGWVGFNTNAAQQFQDFLVLIERPDLLADEELMSFAGRVTRMQEWNDVVHAWTTRHTTSEVLEKAALLRIPVAPVCNGSTILENEHVVARDLYAEEPGGRFLQPRPPYLVNGARPPVRPARPAPGLGEHTGTIEARPAPSRPAAGPAGEAPFSGLRILDTTCWWAGPAATHLLACLGAEVIHVESTRRPDGMRMAGATQFLDRPSWWEWSAFFLSFNTNKRGITLDLGHPAGLELATRLVARSDVVVENYTPRVFEGFGLTWDAVRAANPRIVMVRMPAFGLSGPWRDRVGFAQTMEQFSGMAWITGERDAPPLIPRGPCDPLGGMHAAFAIQVALAERDRTGEGQFVEVPLVESALNVAAEQVLEWTAYRALLERDGNRSPGAAPQGLYACAENAGGAETWLAVSVETDEQWRALRDVLGRPPWAEDPSLDSHEGRRAAHDVLDEELSRWAASREVQATVETLLAAGVPAAAVTDPRAVSRNPQMAARGFFEEVAHPVVGTHPVMTMPFRYTGVDRYLRSPAPVLGQHNHEVLSKELGLDDDEIARLAAEGVIGDRPLGL